MALRLVYPEGKQTMKAEGVHPDGQPRERKPMRSAPRTNGIVAALALAFLIAAPAARAQKAKLSETDVVKLLKGFVSPDRVASLAKERGISFQVTPEAERLLREAGANDNLVGTLKQVAPKPSAPLLVIHSTPGHTQVYVDDTLIGTTSPEGMLKLPALTAGDHKVRLSLEKFNDYEVVAKLVPGETTTLEAKLESAPAPKPNPPQGNAPAPTLVSSKEKLKTFDGTVSDSRCTTKHDKGSDDDIACVKVCVKNRDAKYVLVAKETLRKKVYRVEPQSMFASYAGKRVKVTGVKEGDSITAQSVQPR